MLLLMTRTENNCSKEVPYLNFCIFRLQLCDFECGPSVTPQFFVCATCY